MTYIKQERYEPGVIAKGASTRRFPLDISLNTGHLTLIGVYTVVKGCKIRYMCTDEQRAGMQALLERALQAEKDKGRHIAQIRYSYIAREDWAKGLNREQAIELASFELEHGPWIMLTPYSSSERPFLGADFTYREG
jgi:hypothetical protein